MSNRINDVLSDLLGTVLGEVGELIKSNLNDKNRFSVVQGDTKMHEACEAQTDEWVVLVVKPTQEIEIMGGEVVGKFTNEAHGQYTALIKEANEVLDKMN